MEAVHAALESALDVEAAILEDSPLYAALLDYSKLFDLLPWEVLWSLAECGVVGNSKRGAVRNQKFLSGAYVEV